MMKRLEQAINRANICFPDDSSLSDLAARIAFMDGFCSAQIVNAPNPWHESDPLALAFKAGQEFAREETTLAGLAAPESDFVPRKVEKARSALRHVEKTLYRLADPDGLQRTVLMILAAIHDVADGLEASEKRTEGK